MSAQIQKGVDIDGEAGGDQSGHAVYLSSDGNTVAIGAPFNDENAGNSGQVRIFDWDGSSWLQRGLDIDGIVTNQYLGWSVSLSSNANTVAVGATGGPNLTGQVSVYDWIGSVWQQRGMDITGEDWGDQFGYSVSLSHNGNTLAIGGPSNDENGIGSGHVRLFDWNGTSWEQRGFDIDGIQQDLSGHSISLSPNGNTVAIGSPGVVFGGPGNSRVRVYDWNGTTWQQRGQNIEGEVILDHSGKSVNISMDANTISIGAHRNDWLGSDLGHVRVFDWNGSTWNQRGLDIDGELPGEQSGFSTSLSSDGNSVAIGAPSNNANGFVASGQTRIYDWNGAAWEQRGLDIEGEDWYDHFGYAVSLSSDGNTVAIGGRENNGNGNDAGHVRVFSICSSVSTIDQTSCFDYVSPSGNYTWVESGVYKDTLPNAAGCDSVITIYLNIIEPFDLTITLADQSISANNFNATYQWLDCDNDYANIEGENDQYYYVMNSGNYAVELSENGCIDTSSCVTITISGIIENSFEEKFVVYPNPSKGNFAIEFDQIQKDLSIRLLSLSGQLIENEIIQHSKLIQLELKEPNGIYILEMSNSYKKKATIHLVIE